MKKVILAIASIAVIGVGCSKKTPHASLQTSMVRFNPKTIMTGGNGNGTNPEEYTRYYEIHERNGTVDCIQNGKDCNVKASNNQPTSSQLNDFNILINAIETGTISNYFQGNLWENLFPDLGTDLIILQKLRNGTLYLSKAPSALDTYTFVLSTEKNFTSTNVLKVWCWTFSSNALKQVIGGGPIYDRIDEWSDDGTKCTCINKGQTCSAGIVSGIQQSNQFSLFNGYIKNDQLKKYFSTESWTILFPNLNDQWLNGIMQGDLQFVKLEDDVSISYTLTSSKTGSLNNTNRIHVWLFQK